MMLRGTVRRAARHHLAVLGALAGAKLLLHLLGNAVFGYGYFRDELYYITAGSASRPRTR